MSVKIVNTSKTVTIGYYLFIATEKKYCKAITTRRTPEFSKRSFFCFYRCLWVNFTSFTGTSVFRFNYLGEYFFSASNADVTSTLHCCSVFQC